MQIQRRTGKDVPNERDSDAQGKSVRTWEHHAPDAAGYLRHSRSAGGSQFGYDRGIDGVLFIPAGDPQIYAKDNVR